MKINKELNKSNENPENAKVKNGFGSDEGLNARNVSTSLLPYGGITYFANSFDYPNLSVFKTTGKHWKENIVTAKIASTN